MHRIWDNLRAYEAAFELTYCVSVILFKIALSQEPYSAYVRANSKKALFSQCHIRRTRRLLIKRS